MGAKIYGRPVNRQGGEVMERLRREYLKRNASRKVDSGVRAIHPEEEHADPTPSMFDSTGKRIDSLSRWRKDRLYSRAKELKDRIRGEACTVSEMDNPTPANIAKCSSEMDRLTPLKKEYRTIMRIIGGDPHDTSYSNLRRAR